MPEPAKTRAAPARSGGASGPDWTVQVADTIERVVRAVRDKTATPLTTVARGVVFGLIAAVMAVAVLVLVTVGLVRAVDAYLPGQVWSAHLVVGAVFCLVGAVLLGKATTGRKDR